MRKPIFLLKYLHTGNIQGLSFPRMQESIDYRSNTDLIFRHKAGTSIFHPDCDFINDIIRKSKERLVYQFL
jgi:hypothetical protein